MKHKLDSSYLDIAIICLSIVGMIFSHALMSFAMVFMAIRFVFADKSRIKSYSKDVLIAVFSFFALICLGMIWSGGGSEAWKQLEKSLPFLIVPLYLMNLDLQERKNLKIYAWAYILSLLVATFIGMFNFLTIENPDVRTIMPFCSHIRFALHLTLASSFIVVYCIQNKKSLLLLFALWFEAYMILTSALTGVVISFVVLFFIIPTYFLFKKKNKTAFAIFISAFSLFVFAIISCLSYYYKDYFVPKNGEVKENMIIENGNYIFDKVDYSQMQEGVEKYLKEDRNAVCKSKEGEFLYVDIAIRYLNSKGYEKNLKGWEKLSEKDLENIKKGIPNYVYAEKIPLKSRLYSTFYEIEAYEKENKVKGSSLIQKIELWENSFEVIKNNLLIGVGTGNAPRELKKQLEINNSELADTNMRTHNQYFSIVFSYGIVGLLIWFAFLFYPMFRFSLNKNPYYIIFLAIMLISFFSEDTLDNQAGIMMYCCWNFFFVNQSKK
ncbi:MAG: O-antigen ligase family protein [Bacteroidales bacterium]|nr:O-antigen ligase family protein [Bacteroidales bacterium]